MYRSLTYAYPSSHNAERFGCVLSGCYIVSVLDSDGNPMHEEPHNDRESAIRHYDAMPSLEPYKPTCMRHRHAVPSQPKITRIDRIGLYGSCTLTAHYDNGTWGQLFSYYIDELSFSDDELIGLTEDEAHALYQQRDTEYLRS